MKHEVPAIPQGVGYGITYAYGYELDEIKHAELTAMPEICVTSVCFIGKYVKMTAAPDTDFLSAPVWPTNFQDTAASGTD
jgi:hypothetical protein